LGWLALANAVLNWVLAFANELEAAVEVGGCSFLLLTVIAVGCTVVAMIILACHRDTHRGFRRAIPAIMPAVSAVTGLQALDIAVFTTAVVLI